MIVDDSDALVDDLEDAVRADISLDFRLLIWVGCIWIKCVGTITP